jgi:hypothetical protein
LVFFQEETTSKQVQIMYLYILIYYSKTCFSDLKNLPCMTLVFNAPCIDFFVSTCIWTSI